jgi:hypothetical protein
MHLTFEVDRAADMLPLRMLPRRWFNRTMFQLFTSSIPEPGEAVQCVMAIGQINAKKVSAPTARFSGFAENSAVSLTMEQDGVSRSMSMAQWKQASPDTDMAALDPSGANYNGSWSVDQIREAKENGGLAIRIDTSDPLRPRGLVYATVPGSKHDFVPWGNVNAQAQMLEILNGLPSGGLTGSPV